LVLGFWGWPLSCKQQTDSLTDASDVEGKGDQVMKRDLNSYYSSINLEHGSKHWTDSGLELARG